MLLCMMTALKEKSFVRLVMKIMNKKCKKCKHYKLIEHPYFNSIIEEECLINAQIDQGLFIVCNKFKRDWKKTILKI